MPLADGGPSKKMNSGQPSRTSSDFSKARFASHLSRIAFPVDTKSRPLYSLNIILLCCFIPGIIRGLSKGFLEQALALAGIVLSVWAAFKFSTLVCTWLKPYLNISETTLNIVSFALILIVISLLVVLVAKLLTKVAELAMLGWLDKTLGLVFALAVNALVIGVVIILFDTVNAKFAFVKPEVLDASVVYTTLRDLSYLVFPYLKSFFFKQ